MNLPAYPALEFQNQTFPLIMSALAAAMGQITGSRSHHFEEY